MPERKFPIQKDLRKISQLLSGLLSWFGAFFTICNTYQLMEPPEAYIRPFSPATQRSVPEGRQNGGGNGPTAFTIFVALYCTIS